MCPGLSDDDGLGCQLALPASGSLLPVLPGQRPDAESSPPEQLRPPLPRVRSTVRISFDDSSAEAFVHINFLL